MGKIKKWFVIILGFIVVGALAHYYGNYSARHVNRVQKAKKVEPSSVQTYVVRQKVPLSMQKKIDKAFVQDVEKYIVKSTVKKIKNLMDVGNYKGNREIDLKKHNRVLDTGDKKLGVVNIEINDMVRMKSIFGFDGNQFIRLSCMRNSTHEIPLVSGACSKELQRIFNVSLKSVKDPT